MKGLFVNRDRVYPENDGAGIVALPTSSQGENG